MEAHGDPKTFYRLIREQRSTSTVETNVLSIDGKVVDDPEEMRGKWAQYFQRLATPLEDDNFDSLYLKKL